MKVKGVIAMARRVCRGKSAVIVFLIGIMLMGCTDKKDKTYTGEYPELYSVAINSLLGAEGYFISEVWFDSRILPLEEDAHGRRIFLYFENAQISSYSLLISQKSDDKYVYFYPDYNFISIVKEVEDTDLIATSEKDFLLEDVEELKIKNDWDKELDLEKCVKVEIVREKAMGPISIKNLQEPYEKALGEDAYSYKYNTSFFIMDDYGRSMYLGIGTWGSDRFVVMIFQPDGTYEEKGYFMDIEDAQKYQDQLKAFKEANDWNKPITMSYKG